MVIEDDKSCCLLLFLLFEEEPILLTFFDKPEDALPEVDRGNFQLILMGIQFEGMSGMEATKHQ